jgi:uncharacterized protein
VKNCIRLFTVLCALIIYSSALAAEEAAKTLLEVSWLQSPLTVVNSPIDAHSNPDGSLFIKAPGKTNLFNYPASAWIDHSAPMALFEPKGDFIFTARVSATFKNVYDVCALVIYENERSWAKLCFENSADKEATVVSVVTRGSSDDCNSSVISEPYVYMAICRKGAEYSFHYSMDGKTWKLVRHFSLDTKSPIQLGFAVHAYCDEPVSGIFSEITYSESAPGNMRLLRQ